MKKILKLMLGFLVVLFFALIIIMFALGKEYHFEKSVIINAPAEKVWQKVSSMKATNEWSPFTKLDPNMKQSYKGNPGTVGEVYTWTGNEDVGQGEERITELIPLQKATVDLHFIKPFESRAKGVVLLSPQGKATKVTWAFDTTMDYPTNLMKLFMDSNMDESFGQGLNDLKILCEK